MQQGGVGAGGAHRGGSCQQPGLSERAHCRQQHSAIQVDLGAVLLHLCIRHLQALQSHLSFGPYNLGCGVRRDIIRRPDGKAQANVVSNNQ